MFNYKDFLEQIQEFVEQDDRHGWNGNNIDWDGFRNLYGDEVLSFYGIENNNSEDNKDELLNDIGVPDGFWNEFIDLEFPEEFKMYSEK